MRTEKVQVKDVEGLHARNSARISMAVRNLEAKVSLHLGEREAAADQILEIMALDVKCGDRIEIRSEGMEEEAAMKAVIEILQ